jgi:chromosome segregation protein
MEISSSLDEKTGLMQEKEEQEKKLVEKFNKMYAERDALQGKMQENNLKTSEVQSEIRQIEEQINYLKVGKARLDAEKETIEIQMSEYAGAELLQGSINAIEERLKKVQEEIMQIGSINMRALEVYEGVKKEYDIIQEKVNILDKEKNDILSIIDEIDKKKTKEFMKTFRAINELFTQNFAQLYTKGVAYLEIENKESIFEGGVNIVVKLAKGKFFDATSLSGGEQTLVALSLLFAIQEYKPYHFYVMDEIDAALDKRNSERLAELLKKYMKGGQYIVITHNDAIITESSYLYGVSMYDGVSKILSLKV